MSAIDLSLLGDKMHRLVKLALDTGEAASLSEAQDLFATYKLVIALGSDVAHSATHQAALLTAVNAGRRSMLGGVEVSGPLDDALLVPFPGCRTLAEAVTSLGGRVVMVPDMAAPLVVIGDASADADRPFAVRVTFDGWCGGVAPVGSGIRLAERHQFTPSGVLAGAIAVAEAFQHLRRSNAAAGRRVVGLSLWRPELSWRDAEAAGPAVDRLPSSLWLIGLGNLGQAYLWVLGLLPYARPEDVHLVLQDFDVLTESNDSTSMLTHLGLVGRRKTRAMAAWTERRGFIATIIERRFGPNFRVGSDEPPVALCGVDNAVARAALDQVGFTRIIEAGLGKGVSDYLALRIHVLPATKAARDIWGASDGADPIPLSKPAYEMMARDGADRCGLTQLAGRTVGAPFVGSVAASLVISEAIRLALGAHAYELVDCHMRSLDHRMAVRAGLGAIPFNPGSTPASPA